MKKYAKEIILVLVTVIITSAISVYATVYYNSENVTFTPTNTDWNVTNTSAALNNLYSFTTNGNALASDILTGKTALVGGQLITGTMQDNGAISETIAPGDSYTIPAGYHNGSGKVTASTPSLTGNFENIAMGNPPSNSFSFNLLYSRELFFFSTFDQGQSQTFSLTSTVSGVSIKKISIYTSGANRGAVYLVTGNVGDTVTLKFNQNKIFALYGRVKV